MSEHKYQKISPQFKLYESPVSKMGWKGMNYSPAPDESGICKPLVQSVDRTIRTIQIVHVFCNYGYTEKELRKMSDDEFMNFLSYVSDEAHTERELNPNKAIKLSEEELRAILKKFWNASNIIADK